MRAARYLTLLLLGLVVAGISTTDAEARKKRSKAPLEATTEPLDGGKLIPTWFAKDGLAFVETDEADYFWAKEGFSLEGKTFYFKPWPEPEFLGKDGSERDENDRRLARQMNSEMERSFAETLGPVLGGRAKTSTERGDIVVEGRIVDCSTGSTAAKMLVGFGAGAGYTTIDLKLTDKATGELVTAVHHRVVSGTGWSTTDSKFFKWIRKFGEELEDQDFWGLYQDGDPVRK